MEAAVTGWITFTELLLAVVAWLVRERDALLLDPGTSCRGGLRVLVGFVVEWVRSIACG